VLVVALVVQLVLGAGLILVAVNGFPLIGGGGDGRSDRAPAVAPAVPKPSADRFDAPRAFALIRRELSYGQRPAGSPQLRRLADVLRGELPNGRFEAVPGPPAAAQHRRHAPGRRAGDRRRRHYDSEYHPKGFVGANDSARGTAAVIELARDLRSGRRGPRGALRALRRRGGGPGLPNARFASARCAARAPTSPRTGARSGRWCCSTTSPTRACACRARAARPRRCGRACAAAARGRRRRRLPADDQVTIYDDHTPFLRAGIPAVDLIDFSYRYADG
jgi:hypothetical protein